MADIAIVLDRVAWKRGQKGQTIASRPSSFVMANTSNISNPTFLTENDIPGASLLGRKPEELKISEIKFWLKCCGDAVKRGHDYIQPWFLGRTRAETAFILLWTFYWVCLCNLFNWNCLASSNSDCEVLWTATSGWPCNLQFTCKSYFVMTALFFQQNR